MKVHTIAAGKFKAYCLKLLDEVGDQHKELIITKRGKALAKLIPFAEKPKSLYGFLKGAITIHGDIVSSTGEKWDADHGH